MIRRSFISLFFSSTKLQVLGLNGSKKKVNIFATVDLPEGLIVNHEVKNVQILADILQKIWIKLKIRERSVGIVVPEFSTFTKSVTLPKLEKSELDEAVRWQAQEYMPLNPKDMILDWKILSETAEGYEALIVAMKQDILVGYVDAVASANLFPLVIETPSISLVRVSGETKTVKMTVFFSFDEIILILSQGQDIIASSVLSRDGSTGVVSTMLRMLGHYKDVKVEKIFLGGIGLTEQTVKEISDKVELPIEKLNLSVSNLAADKVQYYLIPLSLQYKNAAEPADITTINLLPTNVVKKYEKKRFTFQLWGLMTLVTFIIIATLVASAGVYIFLRQQLTLNQGKSTSTVNNYAKNNDASSQIKKINQTSDKVLKVLAISFTPQDILNAVFKAKPDNVNLVNYKIDFEKNTVAVAGLAATRDDLIAFKQSLEKSGVFGQVLLPLTSFEIETNLDFELSFAYLPLQNQAQVKK